MSKRAQPPPIIGAEPRYRFVLNPYEDARFTRCPNCEALMRVRKVPLLEVHTSGGWQPIDAPPPKDRKPKR